LWLREGGQGLKEGRIGLHLGVRRVGLDRRRKLPHILFHRHFLRHEHPRYFAFRDAVISELIRDFVIPSQEDQLVQEAFGLEMAQCCRVSIIMEATEVYFNDLWETCENTKRFL